MARGWCLLKPGGQALVGVPTSKRERIYFNGCRMYGPIQFPHLFANWKQIHSNIDYEEAEEIAIKCYYCYQPLVLAEKPTQQNKDIVTQSEKRFKIVPPVAQESTAKIGVAD